MYWTRLQAWDSRINFEVKISASAGQRSIAYTQIYRNDVIGAVRVGVLSSSEDPRVIPSLAYEQAVAEYVPYCFRVLRQVGCTPPVLLGISLIGVRGMRLAVNTISVILAW